MSKTPLASLARRSPNCGGIFDIDRKIKRLDELELQVQNPAVWNDHKEMQKLNQEKTLLVRETRDFAELKQKSEDAQTMIEMVNDIQESGKRK